MSPEAREHSFDELTRGLASGTLSRGRALRLMGAAVVGGALASLGIGEAAADQCKRNGKACKKNSQCCSGTCAGGTCAAACVSSGGSCGIDSDCCSGFLCDNGACATCRSNEGSCSTHGQCCSGYCAGGTCAPCPADRVMLSNGSCAKLCTGDGNECAASCQCSIRYSDPSGHSGYCSSASSSGTICTTDGDCPRGEFCTGVPSDTGVCIAAC